MFFSYQTANTKHPHQLSTDIDAMIEELAELGVNFNQAEPGCVELDWPQDVARDGETCLSLQLESVSPSDLAAMVCLRDSIIFRREVDQLRDRIAALGWSITLDLSRPYPSRSALRLGNCGALAYYDETAYDLNSLRQCIEAQELIKCLIDHGDEFIQAGIEIEFFDKEFKFSLRENDPVITRRLTRKNVDELIAIARAISGCHK